MSNTNTGCFSLFKRSLNRDSDEDSRDIRRGRGSQNSFGRDPLAYLKYSRNAYDRQTEAEFEPKEKHTQENAIQKAREERQERTRSKERPFREPKRETLTQYKKDRSNALALIFDGKLPESEAEIGERTETRRGSGIGIGTATATGTRTGTRTGTATGTGIGTGKVSGTVSGTGTGIGTGIGTVPEKGTESGTPTGAGIRAGIGKRIGGIVTTRGTGSPKTPSVTTESDDEFKRNIEILEQQIDNLELRCKVMATMWLSRLRAPTQNEEEIRARNIITAHLVKCRNDNIFQKVPFNLPPTSDTLANIQQKMFLTRDTPCNDMTLANRMETKAYLNKLFHDSYDCGKFLGKLPVPRDGSFFILHMRSNL